MATNVANPESVQDLEAHFQDEKAFAPTEFFELCEVVAVTTIAMPQRMLEARGIDPASDWYKEHFGAIGGIQCVDIALRGIDVKYAYSDDELRHVTIPMVNFSGDNIGRPKGENSQLHITNEAWKKVFGVSLFGSANREAVAGRKARFGQHMGRADIDGDTRTWRWPVPREGLPADFEYKGEVRVLQGRAGGDAGSSNGAGAAASNTLSDEDALDAVMKAIVGKPLAEADDIYRELARLQGLPSSYAEKILGKTLLEELYEDGTIDQEANVIVDKRS